VRAAILPVAIGDHVGEEGVVTIGRAWGADQNAAEQTDGIAIDVGHRHRVVTRRPLDHDHFGRALRFALALLALAAAGADTPGDADLAGCLPGAYIWRVWGVVRFARAGARGR
jgi:hypothetical protein